MDFNVENSKIVVVGAGKTGISASNFLVKKGAEVVLNDKNSLNLDKINVNKNVQIADNGHNKELFDEADLIVISPGVNVKELPIDKNKKVISDIELFCYFNKTKIISITGTNGKTTTTFLAGEILNKKYRTFVGGNIGVPVFEKFLSNNYDLTLLELSSFQLENIEKFYTDIGVILNITPDHLDRYCNFDEYKEAKLNIFKNNDENQIAILNKELSNLKNIKLLKSKKIFFDINNFFKNNKIIVTYLDKTVFIDTEKLHIIGKHFFEDIYVAALIGLIFNVDREIIEDTIYNFRGLAHRLELVKKANGVMYYNDSKSTTISSTCKAIESFSRPVILIIGGIHKGGSFRKIGEYNNIKKIVCIGRDRDTILKELSMLKPVEANNLEDAVIKAQKMANYGDIILFSPGCSSFDMFKNYIERGNRFKELLV